MHTAVLMKVASDAVYWSSFTYEYISTVSAQVRDLVSVSVYPYFIIEALILFIQFKSTGYINIK